MTVEEDTALDLLAERLSQNLNVATNVRRKDDVVTTIITCAYFIPSVKTDKEIGVVVKYSLEGSFNNLDPTQLPQAIEIARKSCARELLVRFLNAEL